MPPDTRVFHRFDTFYCHQTILCMDDNHLFDRVCRLAHYSATSGNSNDRDYRRFAIRDEIRCLYGMPDQGSSQVAPTSLDGLSLLDRNAALCIAKRKDKPYNDGGKWIGRGCVSLLIGMGMVSLSWVTWHWAVRWQWNPMVGRIYASGFLLTGISLIGHFGLLNIGAGLWRKAGFDCQPLFRNPLQSRSLNDFWSRRWNLAFSEMTSLGVYRPLAAVIGKNSAAFASFLFSGILHELAISLPVRQGYGMPLLYFFIHGCGIVIEHLLEKQGYPISKLPWIGRLWTVVWLVVPLPLLFHSAFLKGIVWPVVGIH